MQNAGSSTDGRATKVLWRMLMTGRALHRKQTSVLPAWPLPGQAQGLGLHGPSAEGRQSWGSMQTGLEGRKAPIHHWPGLPQQHDAVRQAPHQQVWVGVPIHIHLSTQ